MKLLQLARILWLAAACAAAVPTILPAQAPARAAAPAAAQATAPPAETAPLTIPVPVDPRITVGTLPNGLRYYIRHNTKPEGRAELRLVVNAGSVLEDDDQRGLAHVVEHMAFNGTRHFPKQDIISFLQSTGMRFGAHVNANTSFDQTVYQLQIPTDDAAVIDRALLALEDWAVGVSFDADEIDKERGVVLEEWRLGLGADARLLQKQLPVMLKGSRYADRLPIGTPDSIRTFAPERLKQFYKDWYRPDLMAVVAVGDFDAAAVEALIKTHFSRVPAATAPKPRPRFDVPEHPGTRFTIATDPEATVTVVNVSSAITARDQTTIGNYRLQTAERAVSGLLSARLGELSQKPDAPFLAAGTNRSLFVSAAELTSMTAVVPDGGVEKGLAALFAEADRMTTFGITETELERYKVATLRAYERLSLSRDEHLSGTLADEYIRNFMQQEPIPGINYEFALIKRFLPTITLAEVNGIAKTWMPDRNRVVAVSAPQKTGVAVPDEARLSAIISGGSGTGLTAYVDAVSQKPLLDKPPTPGRIVKTEEKPAFGITEWTLSNGARVVVKPTTFSRDQILFRAFSPGGTSLASDRDFIAADTASQVISQGGLGGWTRIDLSKKLAGHTASVRPEIDEMREGVLGGSDKDDLETLFQLLYLTVVEPRADPDAFRAMVTQLQAGLSNRNLEPEAAFNDTLNAAVTQNHLRSRPLTPELVGEMSLDKSLAFYKDRFADLSDFTFVFVGSVDTVTLKPLVEKYVASLPSINRREKGRDVGMRPPDGVVEKVVKSGREPKSQVSVVFSGPFVNTPRERLILRGVTDALEGNLQRVLREELGGTYGVSVDPQFAKLPTPSYRVSISFACDPARTDALVKALFDTITQFKTNGPGENQMADARAALARDYEVNSKENSYLLNQITFAYEHGEDLQGVFDRKTLNAQLTAEAVTEAARRYLDLQRYVKVTLVPAGEPAP
ncbi:MAG: insulinase family protein [Vicinamibacteraceae bacterium]